VAKLFLILTGDMEIANILWDNTSIMESEDEIITQDIEVLTPGKSVQELLKYLDHKPTMSLTEVNKWLVNKYHCEKNDPDGIWEFDENSQGGIGFINMPIGDIEVGMYFQHPKWRDGKICRVNNQIDIWMFLNIAMNLKSQEDAEERSE